MYKGKGSCDVKRGNENYCMNKNIKFNSETGYGLRSMLLNNNMKSIVKLTTV